jgi:hypothetical protein
LPETLTAEKQYEIVFTPTTRLGFCHTYIIVARWADEHGVEHAEEVYETWTSDAAEEALHAFEVFGSVD